LFRIAGDGRGDEDLVAPHDGRRVGEAWDFDAPDDVGALGGVPFHRGFGAVAHAGSRWTAELRPIARECRAVAAINKHEQTTNAVSLRHRLLEFECLPPCFSVKLFAESNSTSRLYAAIAN
jgi:hypothetical protein